VPFRSGHIAAGDPEVPRRQREIVTARGNGIGAKWALLGNRDLGRFSPKGTGIRQNSK